MNTFDQMIERGHELVCFRHDPEAGLRAIIAVHSTALGPGFGGARRWYYATESEALYDVLRLAEGMTYKAACANVAIGGAKAVVMLPRPGHPAAEAEARAMGRFVESLGGVYLTAEDVGLTPQYVDWMSEETRHVTGGRTSGGDPSPHTALGVFNAMKAGLAHAGRPVEFAGVTVAIQGAGNVGSNLARILHEHGASIIVADLDEAAVKRVVEATGAAAVAPDEILTTECDILSPCALGAVIDGAIIPRLRTKIVCGGANNILEDYDEDGAAMIANDLIYVPDFIANAGGLIELAGLHIGLSREQRAQRIADVEKTARQVLAEASTSGSAYAAAVALAKRRITEASKEQMHAG
jgi:glutamate dehydrogenase/leucine dehydrogenase